MIFAENILICIAVPLVIALLFIRGKNRLFVISFLIGMVLCLLGAYIAGFINFTAAIGENDTAVFISPVIEELMKFIPLLFYVYIFEPGEDRMITAAVGIGAGFSLFENCCFILTYGADSITYILIRSAAVGVMHIVSILALAFGFSLAIRFRVLTLPSIVGAVALSMTFHGLYNLLVSEPGITSWIGYVLPVFTAFLLYYFFRRFEVGKNFRNGK